MAHFRVDNQIIMDQDFAKKHLFWTGIDSKLGEELHPRLQHCGKLEGFYVVTVPEGEVLGIYAKRPISSLEAAKFINKSYWMGETPDWRKIELAYADRVE